MQTVPAFLYEQWLLELQSCSLCALRDHSCETDPCWSLPLSFGSPKLAYGLLQLRSAALQAIVAGDVPPL